MRSAVAHLTGHMSLYTMVDPSLSRVESQVGRNLASDLFLELNEAEDLL